MPASKRENCREENFSLILSLFFFFLDAYETWRQSFSKISFQILSGIKKKWGLPSDAQSEENVFRNACVKLESTHLLF